MKTIVVFRVWRGKDGEVFALFPAEQATHQGHCSSYAHVGQHSAADYHHCIASSRPARPKEYEALQKELESLPYDYELMIRKRYTRK